MLRVLCIGTVIILNCCVALLHVVNNSVSHLKPDHIQLQKKHGSGLFVIQGDTRRVCECKYLLLFIYNCQGI